MRSPRVYPGHPIRDELDSFKSRLAKRPKLPRPVVPVVPPLKRVVTSFGVVEMPQDMDPGELTADHFLDHPYVRKVPDDQLPEATRSYISRLPLEPIPDRQPKTTLTEAQLCMLFVISELGEAATWNEIWLHMTNVYPMKPPAMCKVRDALLSRDLITSEGRLTPKGRARVREQDEMEQWQLLNER